MVKRNELSAEAALAATHARAVGLTQLHIASALNASQSQVSRVLSGNARRRSRLFDAVCKYVFSCPRTSAETSASNLRRPSADIDRALDEVWDGTYEHARALALVIRSLAALGPSASLDRPRIKRVAKRRLR